MTRVSRKHYLLVAFLLLCFISTTARAQSLPKEARETEKGHDDQVLTAATEDGASNVDELVAVDYTPARRKPPIHN
ncbi:Encodes a root meristem growth factor, Belongs to a family of functionally redundant ous peptides that are secreted, putative [Theobroma cacao]|uniref:Encodes a root meristem growth factor, Belongs to a family of functionally redundant ous peptides that are secreted, putative n=1 Tax=Theobroma cacao TaxID=3641 RepID=A0A061F9K3_THECC|nr:Encodes a root meristem growth factor, Belongs to a family of functionally redundant ous peptides that are secreted, putative [Theobroma cacao]